MRRTLGDYLRKSLHSTHQVKRTVATVLTARPKRASISCQQQNEILLVTESDGRTSDPLQGAIHEKFRLLLVYKNLYQSCYGQP